MTTKPTSLPPVDLKPPKLAQSTPATSAPKPEPEPAKLLKNAVQSARSSAAKPTIRPTSPTPRPLTSDELARIPAGASSAEALCRATGGKIERVEKIKSTNALILNMDGRRFVYARAQQLNNGRETAYGTAHLRKKLDPGGKYAGCHLDHVASTGVEGKRMGMRYVLMAFVKKEANQSHGATVEKGPVPVREAAKAFKGGLNRDGKDHVTYMTQEMVDKLSGIGPTGKGHSVYRSSTARVDRKAVTNALMADVGGQKRLAALARTSPSSSIGPQQQQSSRTARSSRGR